jgi:hypothetical protein
MDVVNGGNASNANDLLELLKKLLNADSHIQSGRMILTINYIETDL